MKIFILIFLLTFLRSFGFGQYRTIIDSLKHELAIAKDDSNRIEIIRRLSFNFDGSNQDSSRFYIQKGLDLARKINYPIGEAMMLDRSANFYWISGDYPKSLSESFSALKIADAIHYPRARLFSTNTIGLVYSDLKDYNVAINYFQKALKLNAPVNSIPMEAAIYGNILRTYINANQLDSALVYALKLENNEKFLKAGSHALYTYMASIHFYFGNYPKAFKNIHKSIEINKAENDHRLLSTAYLAMAKFYKKLNQADSCVFYAKNALSEAQSVGAMKNILESSDMLAELYNSKSLKDALYYHKISKSVNEELYGASKVLGLQKIIADEQKRQREIEEERIENQNRLKQYVLFTGIGVLLLIAFILYRNNRQKQKANAILEKTLSTLQSTQAQLIQSEKLASLGELTAGIAHEIQNPLNFVNNFSEISVELADELKAEIKKPELDKGLIEELASDLTSNQQKINHHGQRASSIVKGMLEHSRASTGLKEPSDLNALADEFLRLAYHGLRAKDNHFNAQMETHFDPDLPKVSVIPQDIGRVLLNLINNAFYTVAERSRSTVQQRASVGVTSSHADTMYQPTVTVSTQKTGDQIIIKVKDNGNGIPESIREKIFQPFFTTKPTGQGTGLGLSLAYDIIVKGHRGVLEVESQDQVGSTFIISLPLNNH